MAGKKKDNLSPRINNRRALHEYAIEAKLECGIALQGSEVKSLRNGRAQLQESFARVEHGELILHGCHIEHYEKATIANGHEPLRERKLLVHKRELKRLVDVTKDHGVTLIPLSIYFKGSYAKVEIGVARGRKHQDKRRAIREREMDRDLRKATMTRRM